MQALHVLPMLPRSREHVDRTRRGVDDWGGRDADFGPNEGTPGHRLSEQAQLLPLHWRGRHATTAPQAPPQKTPRRGLSLWRRRFTRAFFSLEFSPTRDK